MTTTVEPTVKAVSSHLHPTPSWNPADHEAPTGREETWRFTPVKSVAPLFEAASSAEPFWTVSLPAQATSRQLSDDETQALSFDPPIDLVASNAGHAAGGATLIEIGAEQELTEPVFIDVTGTGQRADAQLIVEVGHHSKATIVLRHTGVAQFASKVEVHVGDEANVDIVSLQDWSEGAVHGGQFSIKVGRNAHVRSIQASIGGDLIRLVERAEYAGPGGSLEQFGIYFVDAKRHVEHRLFVDHNAPETNSHVDYRGALQGKGAHSVWIGDVLIRAVAKNIETYETNKNLVLTEGCQADSVPNLEIETGEIKGAGHSSSTGRFDDEQLFYLRSRGIPEEQARRLIVEGFFLDLIRRIGVPQIEERLVEALNAELVAVEGVASESALNDAEDEA